MAIMMLIEALIWATIERRASRPRKHSAPRRMQHLEALSRSKIERSIMSLGKHFAYKHKHKQTWLVTIFALASVIMGPRLLAYPVGLFVDLTPDIF